MLMVIFGAGASFDSSPTYTIGMVPPENVGDAANNFFRPPLAKDLFQNRPLFMEAVDAFPQCRSIVPRLRDPAVTSGTKSIETLLRQLEIESRTYARGKLELYAVRCYLQKAIFDCQLRWRGVTRGITNYLSLLREIERVDKNGEPVCLVTFNYDTLLEDALGEFGLTIHRMDDYTKAHRLFKVFKLHGSVNWAQAVNIRLRDNTNKRHPPSVLKEQLDRFAELDHAITEDFGLCLPGSMGVIDERPVFPAIAIPVEKKSQFSCPRGFLEQLEEFLPDVSKILIIGWRATEEHFLQLLRKHLKQGVRLYTVAGSTTEAVGVNRHLISSLPGRLSELHCFADPSPTGFTEFMRSSRVASFLDGSYREIPPMKIEP